MGNRFISDLSDGLLPDEGTKPIQIRGIHEDSSRSGIGDISVEGLEIRNFKCIEHLSLDFTADSTLEGDWTCIVGVNGSGKSSLLQALCLVLLGESAAPELGSRLLNRMRRHDDRGQYDAELVANIRLGSARQRLALRLTEDGARAAGGSSEANDEMRRVWKRLRSHLLLSYGSTRNLSDYFDRRYENLAVEVQRQMTLFDPLTQVSSAEALLSTRTNPSLFELISRLFSLAFEEDVELAMSDGFLRFTVDGARVEAVDLPDGFRAAVSWLADLATTWFSGQDHESVELDQIEATVLIDEIDLHLHPSLQRELIPRLRRALPRVQWIVTTHSPLVLSSFDMAELILLDHQAEGGTRELDRQILGFSTDDVYRWLMDTPPTSAEIEGKLRTVTDADREEVRLLLEVSPEVDTDEARTRLERRRALIAKLDELDI